MSVSLKGRGQQVLMEVKDEYSVDFQDTPLIFYTFSLQKVLNSKNILFLLIFTVVFKVNG